MIAPAAVCVALFTAGPFFPAWSAESAGPAERLTLRKSVGERDYKGRNVEVEERRVAPGDSLWRILIQEKGLSSKRFSRYLVVIRGLNPQVGSDGMLRVGDTLFVPIDVEPLVALQDGPAKTDVPAKPAPALGATQDYRVQAGDNLYLILRDQLGIADERSMALYYALVKDLNPQKTNWNLLVEGETIRLPVSAKSSTGRPVAAAPDRGLRLREGTTPEVSAAEAPTSSASAAKHAAQIPARENVGLIARVMEALGNEVQRSGQEVLPVKDGTVRLERSSFPLLYNRKLNQKVILDADGRIPPAIHAKLAAQSSAPAVFSLPRTMTIKEAVSELLSRLGFQAVSTERPVVVQEAGLAFEARGDWMALAPEESNKRQEIFIINLTDKPGAIPDYLRSQLTALGLHLKEVSLSSVGEPLFVPTSRAPEFLSKPKALPHDKAQIIDALLAAYSIRFGVAEALPVVIHEGLKIETVSDRVFTIRGRRVAIFFRPLEPEMKRLLQEKGLIKPLELDLAKLSSREVIGKVLAELDDQAAYREHRFNAASGTRADALTITAWGFLLSKPGMLITDREIPGGYQRFFFDQGLDIVYFR
jgi:hypothetical protein